MGAYDELVLTITFKKDTPKQVFDILQFHFLEDTTDNDELAASLPPLPDHPFFEMEDWNDLFAIDHIAYFGGESYYKLSQDAVQPDVYHFTCRAIMRMSTNLVCAFLHWLLPYSHREGFHGYTRMDELPDHNSLIYVENGEIYFYEAHISRSNSCTITRYKVTVDGRMIKTESPSEKKQEGE